MYDLHYIEKGRGLPLVLLHGFPVDCRIFNRQVENLSHHCRVITIDLPGFGKSSPASVFTMDSVANEIHALLKKIHALPCILGGLSMGGYISLAFYQHCPSDIKGLILIDTRAPGDTPEGKQNRNKLIEEVNRCGSAPVIDSMMPKVLADETVAAQPQVVGEVRQMMQDCPPATMAQALAALRDRPDRTELLPSIAEPVLIIVGQCDEITPIDQAELMRQAIPHATLAKIPDAGHFSPVENPSAVNQAIRKFLTQFR